MSGARAGKNVGMNDELSTPRAGTRSGDAYLVQPDAGPGRGVLVLHSWWGLTDSVKELVEALADAGYTTLAPDLCHGELPADAAQAQRILSESDPNKTAALVLDSVVALRAHTVVPQLPIAVVGFSMGASWGLWLATRQAESVAAAVAYYGTQNIDFDDLVAPVLGHFAEEDPMVTEDDLTEMHARLLLSERSVQIERYPGVGHWFAEPGVKGHFDSAASDAAWDQTLSFLAEHLPTSDGELTAGDSAGAELVERPDADGE